MDNINVQKNVDEVNDKSHNSDNLNEDNDAFMVLLAILIIKIN